MKSGGIPASRRSISAQTQNEWAENSFISSSESKPVKIKELLLANFRFCLIGDLAEIEMTKSESMHEHEMWEAAPRHCRRQGLMAAGRAAATFVLICHWPANLGERSFSPDSVNCVANVF